MMNALLRSLVLGSIALVALPATAQVCVPMRVVEGASTQVQKQVSPPNTGVTRSNWNTDFAVPTNRHYSRFVATVFPQNGGEYRVQLALKYPDNSVDTAYDRTIRLGEKRSVSFTAIPRSEPDPYQLNVSVGGVRAVGNRYTVRASACY